MKARSFVSPQSFARFLSLLVVLATAGGPLLAEEAEWIWWPSHKKNKVPRTSCYFRKTFNIQNPEEGQISIVADDEFDLYLNGRKVGSGNSSKKLQTYNVTRHLTRGRNTVAIRVSNTSGSTAALATRVLIKEKNQDWASYSTDDSWRANLRPLPLWNTTVYNDRRWNSVQSFGRLGETPPWDRKEAVATTETHRNERFRISEEFRVERLLDNKTAGSLIALTFNEFGHAVVSREGGPLLLIYDSNADGILDGVRTYCDKVKNCQGILCLNGEVFVTAEGPDGQALYRLRDEDRDGQLESVTSILKFKTESQEHGAHGVALGPDGLIYVVVGNHATVVGDFEKSSPHRNYYEGDLLRPKYEDPGGHATGIKAPGGIVIRTDTTGNTAQIVAGGLRNAYDLVFNTDGEMFIHDSDMESDEGATWYRPTQLFHILPGGEFGWRSGWSKWSEHYLDALAPLLETGRGSPTGAAAYNHYMFPQRYHNALFLGDWSEGRILAVKIKKQGGSYVANSEVFLEGSPLNVTDLEVGPDGSLYFVTGGRGTSGGLYRVTWRGKVPKSILNLGSGVGAVIRQPQLQSAWSRQQVARLQTQLGDQWEKLLIGVARSDANPSHYRTRAMDLLQLYGPSPTPEFLIRMSEVKNEAVRAKAADLMGLHPNESTREALIKLLTDSERLVRRKSCEALLRAEQSVPARGLIRSLSSDDRSEAWAARRLLERLPIDSWKSLILKTDDHRIFVHGAMALIIARPTAEDGYDILERASELMTGFVSDRNFIDMLRVIQVVLERTNIEVESLKSLAKQVGEEFPSSNTVMNRELARLLVYLQAGDVLDRFLNYLESDMPVKERVHVALMLRFLKQGWTGEKRLKLLRFYEKAAKFEGGSSYPLYVLHVSRDFAKTLAGEDARIVLDEGAKWPNAALAALTKLPSKLDSELMTKLKKIDTDIHGKEGKEYTRLRVGIVAVLARSGDKEAMSYLRRIWSLDPERRPMVAMGLAQQPKGENWPYLIRSLRVVDGVAAREVLIKLRQVSQRPQEGKYYRDVILCGLKLQDKGGDQALRLLEFWTGEERGDGDAKFEEQMAAWQTWFAEKYPDEPEAKLPVAAKSKWTFDELLEYLESDEGLQGSKTRGAAVFVKASCNKCHRLGDQGERMGPDLTNLKKRFMRKEVLESILYPSHVISDQYISKVILTEDGKTYSGIIASGAQGEKVILQANGEKTIIPEDDIVEMRTSKVSSMPDGLLNTLTQQEIADLFKYLDVLPNRQVATRPSSTKKK